jgi:hypothetical protein
LSREEQIAVDLLNSEQQIIYSWELGGLNEDYPVWEWGNDERWRQQHRLRLPAGIGTGTYHLSIDGVVLSTIEVEEPARNYQLPIGLQQVDAFFENGVHLVGIVDGFPEITLVWQIDAELDDNLYVFVHLVTDDGEIIAQSDMIPANWDRPMSGWVPGELIIDQHTLAPSTAEQKDELQLHIGIYNPRTFQRIAVRESDYVVVPLAE